MFKELLSAAPYSIRQADKERAILDGMHELMELHYNRCAPYARIIDLGWGGLQKYDRLSDVPYLPVGLFKELELSSTPTPTMVMRSSGTSGQIPSRIFVDPETASRQSEALVATFRPILGDRRIPFLVFDTAAIVKGGDLTARGAGVLGMMKFGAKTTFALTPDLQVDKEVVRKFLAAYGGAPFLIFGFTYLVWLSLYKNFADGELDLSNAVLVHSGGWKRLEAERVSNSEFRKALKRRFNASAIYNFYGFVEQLGSIFLEGKDGLLYSPNFTDVIVRRPDDWTECAIGEVGVIQVLSLLPKSYPGHSVLTEDLGSVEAVDAGGGGRLGKGIRIVGRVPKSELRGCSDVMSISR